jgi:hypothetical protein
MAIFLGGSPWVGRVNHFFDLLSDLSTGIPIQTQFVLWFEGFPVDLINQVVRYESYARAYNAWGNIAAFVDDQTSDPLQHIKGCIFAQGVNTPTEGIATDRVGENYRGGYVKGPITTARNDFNNFEVSFLETNLSFADMVLRPWSIMVAHRSLLARAEDTGPNASPIQPGVNGIKTNMVLFHLAKTGPGSSPIVRKQYNFYDCVPVSISSEDYSSLGDEMKLRQVSFLYSYYTCSADPNMVDGFIGREIL